MNKNSFHYILTFTLAFAASFVGGQIYAQQLFENPDAMKAAYQAAAKQGQAALDQLLKDSAEKANKAGDAGSAEYRQLLDLMNQDAADGQQDGNFPDPNAPPPAPPEPITVYDLNEFDIITDGEGNVVEIKKRKKEGEGEEGEEGKDKEGEGEEGQGGGPGGPAGGGGGQGGAPPGGGGRGSFKESPNPKEEYSRWCWYCTQPGQCKTGSLGSCDLRPCKEDEKCTDHVEKMADGKEIICHECTPPPPPPPPVCEDKGFMSDPACNGKCPPDLCEKVFIAPDGSIRTWTVTKQDLVCYRCGEAPMCKALGFYENPNCDGKCPPEMCEAVYINPQGGFYKPGATMPRNTPKCYRCKNDDDQQEPPPECHGSTTDPLCQGMCSPQQCKVVDTIAWKGQTWSCYDCDESASACTEKGLYDTPNCDGKCEVGSICVPLAIAPDGHIRSSNETRVRGET